MIESTQSSGHPEPPKRLGVERSGPPGEVFVDICPWCGSQPLIDTGYCGECDLVRHDWLSVRYRLAAEKP